MHKKQFLRMLGKYRRGTATPEERRFVEAYDALLAAREGEEDSSSQDPDTLTEEMLAEAWARIGRRETGAPAGGARIRRLGIAAAAAVLLALALVGIVLYREAPKTAPSRSALVSADPAPETIHPGSNRAVLTLAGGKQILLDSARTGLMARQGSTRIVQLNGGQLAFEGGQRGGDGAGGVPQYNNITTPPGGQYKVTLPDGTAVWLNASSSLDFPAAFTGNDRRVRLHGEAYFEVAGDPGKPFIVEADDLRIRVLGTHFDIAAYGDERTIRTTLSEGMVQVSARGESHVLRPGEQAGMDRTTGDFRIAAVNVDQALAWKNGLFYFDNTNIRVIMREVARWYNAEIVYETSDFTHKNFSGVVSRYSEVDALLKRLELTGAVHFKVEGNRIFVMN